jgi:hypothetical protein
MQSITTQEPIKLSQSWGASFSDYKIGENPVDFQDLMVAVAENRATTGEGEVTPLTTRIRARNAKLDIAGALLSIFTKAQADFKSDAEGNAMTDIRGIKSNQWDILREAYIRSGGDDPGAAWDDDFANSGWSKRSVEGMVQALKSMIDGMNNEAQTDMSRLQSLVDRRDESFSTATTLMTSISDTRGNLIRNF